MAGGKTIWITGAGTGIGRACAIALAREGHAVTLSGRRVAPLEETAALARDARADSVVDVMPGDLSDRAEAERIAAAIQARHGRLDCVVGAAGVNVKARMWSELSAGDMDALLDGNLRNQMYTVAAALPLMRARRDGLFIIVSSIAGRTVAALSGPMYTTTKHGLTALAHSINVEECVNGIRACALHPGEVDTPLLAQRPKQLSPAELATVLRPEDVAAVVAFVVGTPAHVCLNEIWVTPTHNRGYVAQMGRGS
jgi:NADP-dependent 3-hydroxy acid dehydrogenase YdfG